MKVWHRTGKAQSADRSADRGRAPIILSGLSNRQDLIVQGRFDAKVRLHMNNVTIARSGRVTADIHGSRIAVEGEVTGNLFADEEVIVRRTGRVSGNITAPRVILEDGGRVAGSIDMRPAAEAGGSSRGSTGRQ